ncbi:MAG: hypothetical protein JXJ04_26600 [Spirochaetales bacterium]|nr:hypothetical protein [Spirochaetales bacterium]
MKSKESKAMLEVWEWKEANYNEVKQLPLQEQINTIFQMAREETEKIIKTKQVVR